LENSKKYIELTELYRDLLNAQIFDEKLLDYSVAEKHKTMLQQLSVIGNSSISVFDHYKKEHIYYSDNFCRFLGYESGFIDKREKDFIDSKIHPDDFIALTENGISLLKLFYRFSSEEKTNYKLVNEFRILNSEDKYLRVIEQHQILELDISGNLWLSLGIIDISPDQKSEEGLNSQLLNFKTGKTINFGKNAGIRKEFQKPELTLRETEILKLVKEGLLSKEISDKLSISLHTVNTHRQKILDKLGANNSIEAISYASGLGLL